MSRGAAVTVCKSFPSPALDRPQPTTATLGAGPNSVPPEAFGTVRSGSPPAMRIRGLKLSWSKHSAALSCLSRGGAAERATLASQRGIGRDLYGCREAMNAEDTLRQGRPPVNGGHGLHA